MAELKLLGGRPAFDKLVPVSMPTMPDRAAFQARLDDVYASGMITVGKNVAELERRAAVYLGVRNVVALNSNTSGQMLALRAWGLKGEVILPSFSFCVTAHVLAWNGLTPVFVDVDPKTCTLDPAEVEKAITPRTSAIIGVHIWGNPCRAEELSRVARERGLKFMVDAAQAFGAELGGRRVGGFGDAEVFSCSPTKVLTCGEGGLLATDDDALAADARKGRIYGMELDYDCRFPGINARMTEFNAAFGLSSFDELEGNLAVRRERFELYRRLFSAFPGISFPELVPGGRSNCIYFTTFIDEKAFGLTRDELYDAMLAENVLVKKYFAPPLHEMTFYRGGRHGALPGTLQASRSAMTFPLYSHISPELIERIVDAVRRIQARAGDVRAALSRKTATC